MFCHNCGAMYPANARFCTRCGCARIDYSCQSAPVPQIPAAPPVQASPASVNMTEAPAAGSHAVPLGILGGLMTLGLVLYFLTAFAG